MILDLAAAADPSSATDPGPELGAGRGADPGGASAVSARPGALRVEGSTTTTGSTSRPHSSRSDRQPAAPVVAMR